MAFSNFFPRDGGRGGGGGEKNLNIDRNQEGGLLLPGSDRNRISKGVENARVYVERRSHRTRSNRAENLNALFFFFFRACIAKHSSTNPPVSFQREETSPINRSTSIEKKNLSPSFSSLIRVRMVRFVREGCAIMERQIR